MRLETVRYITGHIRILLVTNRLRPYASQNRLIHDRSYTYTTSYI